MKSDVVEKTLKYWCGERSDELELVRMTRLYWRGEGKEGERDLRHSEKRAVMPRSAIGIYVDDDVELPVLKYLNDWFENAKYTYAPEFLVLDTVSRVDHVRIPTYEKFIERVCKVRRLRDYVEEILLYVL